VTPLLIGVTQWESEYRGVQSIGWASTSGAEIAAAMAKIKRKINIRIGIPNPQRFQYTQYVAT
jgi:hypothetical protein